MTVNDDMKASRFLILALMGVFCVSCDNANESTSKAQDIHAIEAVEIYLPPSKKTDDSIPLCTSGEAFLKLNDIHFTLDLDETLYIRRVNGNRYTKGDLCLRQNIQNILTVKSARTVDYIFSTYRDINSSEWDSDGALEPFGEYKKTNGPKDIYYIQRQDPNGEFQVINIQLECVNRPSYNGNCRLASSFDEALIVQSIFNRKAEVNIKKLAEQAFRETLSIQKKHNIRLEK